MPTRVLLTLAILLLTPHAPMRADAPPSTQRTKDVIYGRLNGTALTLDVLTPPAGTESKHLGVLLIVSGGWFSSHDSIDTPAFRTFAEGLTRRGYTVFAVVHGSQPKYTIREILPQIGRATRFVRFHAKDYGVDPDKIGMCGASAGGHLTLMQSLSPAPPDDPKGTDPVDRVDGHVQAAAAFFPPTDFLNFGKPGKISMPGAELKAFAAPFDFQRFSDETKRFERITDPAELLDIGRAISPATHVDANDPPVLLIHGDADPLVPIQQSRLLIERLNDAHVPCKLIEKKGAGHGWPGIEKDLPALAEWFDRYLSNSLTNSADAATTAPAH